MHSREKSEHCDQKRTSERLSCRLARPTNSFSVHHHAAVTVPFLFLLIFHSPLLLFLHKHFSFLFLPLYPSSSSFFFIFFLFSFFYLFSSCFCCDRNPQRRKNGIVKGTRHDTKGRSGWTIKEAVKGRETTGEKRMKGTRKEKERRLASLKGQNGIQKAGMKGQSMNKSIN